MARSVPDIPFAPSRSPFFYGWAVIGLGTFGLLASSPGQTVGVSTFTDPLLEATGLTRDQLSLAYMLGTIGSSLLLTHAGKLYDRLGARSMTAATCVLLGAVLLGLSQCDRIARGVAAGLGTPVWATTFGVMLLGFFALRFTGQGVLAMTSRNMILKWFDRHRGLAIGISGVFVSLGFSLTPRIFDAFIGWWGWRGAWQNTAAIVALGVGGVALLFFRDNPEQCGLTPDGAEPPPAPADPAGPPPTETRQYTLREARRCYAFWIFTFSIAMFGLYVTGLMFHVESIFGASGMTKDQALAIFLPASVVSVFVRLLAGWVADHIQLKYLLGVQLLGLAGSMVGLMLLDFGWTVWLIVGGNGVTMALVGLLSGMAWPRFFGREHLGAISGLAMALTVFFSAIGPYLFSLSFKYTGSYAPAGGACLVATLVLLAGAWRANNPQRSHPA